MNSNIMVWDLEAVPDLDGYARANNLIGKSPEEIRSAMGDEFPKLIYHSIICIGALVPPEHRWGGKCRQLAHPMLVSARRKS